LSECISISYYNQYKNRLDPQGSAFSFFPKEKALAMMQALFCPAG
jgi:hypothetical protein